MFVYKETFGVERDTNFDGKIGPVVLKANK